VTAALSQGSEADPALADVLTWFGSNPR
jgi:hypothetical protein